MRYSYAASVDRKLRVDPQLAERHGSPWCGPELSERNAPIGWMVSGSFEVPFRAHASGRRRHAGRWQRLAAAFPPLARTNAGSIRLRRP